MHNREIQTLSRLTVETHKIQTRSRDKGQKRSSREQSKQEFQSKSGRAVRIYAIQTHSSDTLIPKRKAQKKPRRNANAKSRRGPDAELRCIKRKCEVRTKFRQSVQTHKNQTRSPDKVQTHSSGAQNPNAKANRSPDTQFRRTLSKTRSPGNV